MSRPSGSSNSCRWDRSQRAKAASIASAGDRRVRPGRSARSLRAYPRRQRLARGLFRVAPRSRRIVGVRKGRVRFVAVASQRLLRSQNRRVLRGYLRRAGL